MDQVFPAHRGKSSRDSFRISASPPALSTASRTCLTCPSLEGIGGSNLRQRKITTPTKIQKTIDCLSRRSAVFGVGMCDQEVASRTRAYKNESKTWLSLKML